MQEPTGKPKAQYKEPEGVIARFFWRLWIKISVLMAFSMLETWEIALICAYINCLL